MSLFPIQEYYKPQPFADQLQNPDCITNVAFLLCDMLARIKHSSLSLLWEINNRLTHLIDVIRG